MKKKLKDNWKLYLWVLILSALCFGRYLFFNKGLMVFFGDPFEIYYKLWQGGWRSVHEGTLGQWCWSLGLGANTFSYVFYMLTSPFFWLSCLLPFSFIPYSFLIFQILNMTTGFILTDFWLSDLFENRKAAVIGSFVITFSAYTFFYTQAPQLEYLFICYPVVLLQTEHFLKEGKWKGVVLSIALTGIWNYYLLYLLVPFLIIYTVLRYLHINEKSTFKQLIKAALHYIGYALIGIGAAAFILVPCAYLVFSMPRFSSQASSVNAVMEAPQLYRIFTSLFVPSFAKLDANPFINIDNVDSYGWSGGCSLYSLILTPLFLPCLLKLKDRKEKRRYLIFFSLLIIFLLFPAISYLFQMSIDTRWYYMFVFFNGIVIARVIKGFDEKELDPVLLKKNFLITAGIMALCCIISILLKLNERKLLILMVLVSLAMILFALLYAKAILKNASFRKFLILISCEALFAGCVFGQRNTPIVSWALDSPVLSTNAGKVIQDLEGSDHSFYRVQYNSHTIITKEHEDRDDDTFITMSGNEPYANDYKGFAFYESVYNTNQEDYLSRMKSTWNMTQMVGRTRSYNMLSSKYWYTYDYSNPIPYSYEKVYENKDTGLAVYENQNYVELGYTYENTISADYLKTLPVLEQDLVMEKYLATESSENQAYTLEERPQQLAVLPDDDVRVYTFDEPVDHCILYIENYGLPEVKIRTSLNGKTVNTYDIWQFNYTDIPVYEPIDEIVIEARPLYGGKTQVPLYIEPMSSSYSEEFKKETAEHFENVIASADHIEADITIKDHRKYVFTSIPWDAGWTVKVNGEEIPYEKVQLGFIGFQLDDGTYHIAFEYHTPGLKAGVLISLVSSGIFVLLMVLERKRK